MVRVGGEIFYTFTELDKVLWGHMDEIRAKELTIPSSWICSLTAECRNGKVRHLENKNSSIRLKYMMTVKDVISYYEAKKPIYEIVEV